MAGRALLAGYHRVILFTENVIASKGARPFIKGIKNGSPGILEIRGMQGYALVGDGCIQGTTLSVTDLHNAWATILNPFYNTEYKIVKKIRQNKTWIEADIPWLNLTPNR